MASSAPARINPSASSGGTGNTPQLTFSGSGSDPTGSNTPGVSGATGKPPKHVNPAAIAVPIILVTFLVVVAFLLCRRRRAKRNFPNPTEISETPALGQIRVGITRPPKHDYFGFGSNGPAATDSSARHSFSQTSISHEAPETIMTTGGPRTSTPQLNVAVDLDHLASLVAARIDPTSDLNMSQNQSTNTLVPVRGTGETAALNVDDIMSMVAARLNPSFLTRPGGGGEAHSEYRDTLPSYQAPPVYDDAAPTSTNAYRDEKS
jgi:hypothetical protein